MLGLGLVCYVVGCAGYWVAPPYIETRDFIRNLGHGFFPFAVYNWLAGKYREVNRPEL